MSNDARSARRPPTPSDLLTVREAAARLTVDVTTVKRWIYKGAMQAVAVGPHHRLRVRQRSSPGISGPTSPRSEPAMSMIPVPTMKNTTTVAEADPDR